MTYSTLEEQQLGKLWELYLSFRDSGDDRGARRLFKLLEKKVRNWQAACFCGHFSAGKSTLLNTLLSEDLLPTSPIPTSGNLVRLEPGEESVRVVYKNGESIVMAPPYNLAQLKEWAKNTEEIDEVRIHMGNTFPSNWMLFDTPGIDATDRDHQAATEDAVFLADSVIYVADYNHIQSEANFEFLDRVQRLGRPIYLIVNQIDKHQENEIPFIVYKNRIESSLKEWDIQVERVFFLSLKDLNHPNNDWELFKAFMTDLSQTKSAQSPLDSVIDALIQDHKQWWKETHEVELPHPIDGSLEAKAHELQVEVDAMKKQAELTSIKDWLDQAKQTISRTIESAVLTPYETRELAKAYLEAIQPDFKVGFFSSKAKIQKVREERLQALLEDLKSRIQTLNWQTGDTFYKVVEPLAAQKDKVKQLSQELHIDIDEAFIQKHINNSAHLTGAYILKFADTLASAIQKKMRLAVKDQLEALEPELAEAYQTSNKDKDLLLQEKNQELLIYKKAIDAERQERYHFNKLESILNESIVLTEAMHREIEDEVASPPVFNVDSNNFQAKDLQTSQTIKASATETVEPLEKESELALTMKDLKQASKVLMNAKGFEKLAAELLGSLNRLEHKQLTVALFGAFSAGKSSFANALLGESALKVSPHPTTAVVNRILPVDEAHTHGQMILFMKTENALLQDVQRALKPFGRTLESLDELEKTVRSLPQLGTGYSKGKLYLAFLQAVIKGLSDVREQLGQQVMVDMSAGHEIVADETKACLIDRVDLYFDCEATRRGMILVDTPGADSLNARHTETAYKYIQNADAIVFVTYYQHAFSRADETFLRQLGRIQDAFERDKFFFIVNAIDLARNEEERNQVTQFVTQQLTNLGMHSPRLFGLSSLQALKARQKSDETLYEESGFDSFMKDWSRFVEHDLIEQTLRGVVNELEHSARLLDDFIEKGKMTEEEREHVLDQLKEELNRAIDKVSHANSAWLDQELTQTIEELFYYVKQRLSLQLTEQFSRFFNPSVLRQDSSSKQMAISACLEECLSFLSNELEQEIRSTAIRVEASLNKMLKTYRTQLSEAIDKHWALRELEPINWESASIPYDFIDIPRAPLEKTFRLYKNPKQFFVENGIKTFKEELLSLLSPAMNSYIDEAMTQFQNLYQEQLDKMIPQLRSTTVEELKAQYTQKHESIREASERQESYQEVRKHLEEIGIS
ncbi:dynamin family protein [Pullulanibacillus sp. KACC 23026]|uniref:dynamin family protein n=1 Tax=Pullulanibacillus sp. KACC 23026 TaxID=3028315 RepID=UPI0023AE9103|nr:dynamin family protein [Pullulanibacillus sp. KACC 23026]WEG10871.1 dynamin family protein [Pullulanibacillus sp. KACC 23026]